MWCIYRMLDCLLICQLYLQWVSQCGKAKIKLRTPIQLTIFLPRKKLIKFYEKNFGTQILENVKNDDKKKIKICSKHHLSSLCGVVIDVGTES